MQVFLLFFYTIILIKTSKNDILILQLNMKEVIKILKIVAMFISLDIITGLISSIKTKKFTSRKMREGLYHKGGIILIIALSLLIDYSQTIIDIGFTIPTAKAVCTYVIIMELGSNLENIYKLNPALKKIIGELKNVFKNISKIESKK